MNEIRPNSLVSVADVENLVADNVIANSAIFGNFPNDYSKFEQDGSLQFSGKASVWEDLNFDPTRSGGPVATRPNDVTINNVIHKEFTSANNQFCGAVQEISHSYKLLSTLYPHIHIFLKNGEPVGTTGVEFTFYWELRQESEIRNGNFVLSATSAELGSAEGGRKFTIYNTNGIAGARELGAQIAVRIARTGGNAGDVILTTYGIHYEVDSVGSRGIITK